MSLRLPSPASLLQALASQCAVCHSWPAQRVCAPCIARFASWLPRCTTCALALPLDLSQREHAASTRCAACLRQAAPLDACYAAMAYTYPWSGLVAGYKFGGDPAWAAVFADLLLQLPGVAATLERLEPADCVLPMPLSAERLQTRGFNQAWELAKALAQQSGTRARCDARLLLRIKNTLPQSSLKRDARLRNVKGAFVAEPLRATELRGRRVLLVDDVMTSGASLFAAAQALREAGVSEVTGVVFARTE